MSDPQVLGRAVYELAVELAAERKLADDLAAALRLYRGPVGDGYTEQTADALAAHDEARAAPPRRKGRP